MYAKAIAKDAKAKGFAYYSHKAKKVMPAAKVGADCLCARECFNRVGQNNIKLIFDEYYKIGDNYEAKSAYLMGLIRPRTVKQRRM